MTHDAGHKGFDSSALCVIVQVRTLIDKDSTVELNAGDDHSKPETKQSRPGEVSAEPVQWSLQPQLVRAKRAQLTETWGKSFSYSLLRGRETLSTPYCT